MLTEQCCSTPLNEPVFANANDQGEKSAYWWQDWALAQAYESAEAFRVHLFLGDLRSGQS